MVISKEGTVTTNQGSSFVYFVRRDPTGGDTALIKIHDGSEESHPLDSLIYDRFLHEAELATQHIPV